jgi:hypothetical protein
LTLLGSVMRIMRSLLSAWRRAVVLDCGLAEPYW